MTDLTSFRRLRLARSSDRIGEIVEDDNGGKPALTVLPFQFSNLRRLHRPARVRSISSTQSSRIPGPDCGKTAPNLGVRIGCAHRLQLCKIVESASVISTCATRRIRLTSNRGWDISFSRGRSKLLEPREKRPFVGVRCRDHGT